MGDNTDKMNRQFFKVQEDNDLAIHFLDSWGYLGHIFQVQVNKVKFKVPVTVPHSKERIHLLADATSHGAKFTATGSDDFTGDDVFKSMEVKVWRQRIKRIEVAKKERMARLAEVKKGGPALEIIVRTNIDVLSGEMKNDLVDALLVWYEVPDSDGCHFIADRRKNWMEIRGTPPPMHALWTEEDEVNLSRLK